MTWSAQNGQSEGVRWASWRRRSTWALVLCGVGTACSASTSATAPSSSSNVITSTSVVGTYAGQQVPTTEVLGLFGVGTSAGTYAGVIITNISGACALFKSAADPATAGTNQPNAVQLHLAVQPTVTSATSSPVPAGTYSVHGTTGSGNFVVQAGVEATDGTCSNESITANASGGNVELVSVTPSMVTGRFDLTFASGDHLTGQFAAPVCDFDLNALSQNGLAGCAAADAGSE